MNYATSFPAASMSDDYLDRVVTQGHADYCAERGHATYTKDDVVQDFCPRCGAVTAEQEQEQEQEQVTPTGTIPNEGDLYPFTTSYGKDTIIERVTSVTYYMDNSIVAFSATGRAATVVYPHGDVSF